MSRLFPMVDWAQGTNVYEMNTRQYTQEGNFQSLIPHLSRLKDMGIGILWLMPITPISIKGRLGSLGSYYACSSYIAINPEYGHADDFQKLVDAIHQHGMKIIIDWVANHTGQDHEWTTSHPDYYEKDSNGNFVEKNGWSDVIDLDFTNQEMRQSMISAMQFWVQEFGIDGFRCDMAHLVPLDFWKEARSQCDNLKPLFWMAECDDNQYLDVFDANYAWRWMHATAGISQSLETSLQDVTPLLLEDLDLLPYACKLWFTSNHDENSWNGSEYEKYGKLAKTWAAFTCLFPGIPLIYSGQELPNYKRLAFFEKDLIEWTTTQPALHTFYQRLLHLRKQNACFETSVNCKIIKTGNDSILVFILRNEKDCVLALFNFSEKTYQQLDVIGENLTGKYTALFSGLSYDFQENEHFVLEPCGYLIYVKESVK